MSSKRACLLVLGMHRSGTSALSGALSISGAGLPQDLMPPSQGNRTGYWESQRLMRLNDIILRELNYSWHDFKAFHFDSLSTDRKLFFVEEVKRLICEEFGSAPLFVLKDPRVCLLFDLYSNALAALGVDIVPIIIFRNPLEVCESLAARDRLTRSHSQLVWLRHVLESLISTKEIPRVTAFYPDTLYNWTEFVSRVNGLLSSHDVVLDGGSATSYHVSRFAHPGYRHHSFSSLDLESRTDVSVLTKRCFADVVKLHDGERVDLLGFEDLKGILDDVCGLFVPLIEEERRLHISRIADLKQEMMDLQIRSENSVRDLRVVQQLFDKQKKIVDYFYANSMDQLTEIETLRRADSNLLRSLNEMSVYERWKFVLLGSRQNTN